MSHNEISDEAKVASPKILVMGVGSSGARTVAHLSKLNPRLEAAIIDTDTKVLEEIQSECIIHVGGSVTNGFSAGGDVELGRQAIEKDSSSIRKLLRQTDLLIIVAGLGGGTGSGAVPVITRIAREAGTLVLCMVSLPFDLEGKPISRKAEDALKKIRTHADAIVRLSNEFMLVRSDADISLEDAFSCSHHVMIEGVVSLWRLLTGNGVCGLDFACIQTMLRNCDGFCHFASVKCEGKERGKEVISRIIGHRLLNGGKTLEKAAGIIIGLTGGPDLALSEVECIMTGIQEKLPEDTWLNFGVTIDPSYNNCLSTVVLVAEQWKEPLIDDAGRQMGFTYNRRPPLEQGELPLETVGKGRFTGVDSTVYDGQDLDVPTYIRRSIRLPR
jgi:cell division protein FtsZ